MTRGTGGGIKVYMYDFYTDTVRASDYYIWFRSYPVITRGKQKVTFIEVPGRYGTLVKKEKNWSDTVVNMEIDITVPLIERHSVDQIYGQFREQVLRSTELYLEELHSGFFRVKNVEETGYLKETDITVSVDLSFICDPGDYIVSGKYEHEIQDVLWNPYSECCPIYLISGEGNCVLAVNGNVMEAQIGQNLTIDTELMVSYRTDGIVQNTAVTGNYNDLYLCPGSNEISITNGFDLKIIPNWRIL